MGRIKEHFHDLICAMQDGTMGDEDYEYLQWLEDQNNQELWEEEQKKQKQKNLNTWQKKNLNQ